MKKAIAFLLTGAMVLSMTACGGSSAPADKADSAAATESAAAEETTESAAAEAATEEAAAEIDGDPHEFKLSTHLSAEHGVVQYAQKFADLL